ncbi:MAG: metFprotein [Gammaproteobacteria bacterium]|nr:metFprotein [Gammaproteobacteria bacterium]
MKRPTILLAILWIRINPDGRTLTKSNHKMKTFNAKVSLKGWSIEITPKESKTISCFSAFLEKGTKVNVTSLPKTSVRDTLTAVEKLKRDGMNPIPHITARTTADEGDLARVVEKYADLEISEVLIIAGTKDQPAGRFSSSADLISSGVFEHFGIVNIGVAGHPEGSPDITEQQLQDALDQKNHLAVSRNLNIFLETQFCFDAQRIINWEKVIRDRGNMLPIRVGIAGPTKFLSLINFAIKAGVGPSLKFLINERDKLTKLVNSYDPTELICSLAPQFSPEANTCFESVHFYAFGGFRKTAVFAQELFK